MAKPRVRTNEREWQGYVLGWLRESLIPPFADVGQETAVETRFPDLVVRRLVSPCGAGETYGLVMVKAECTGPPKQHMSVEAEPTIPIIIFPESETAPVPESVQVSPAEGPPTFKDTVTELPPTNVPLMRPAVPGNNPLVLKSHPVCVTPDAGKSLLGQGPPELLVASNRLRST